MRPNWFIALPVAGEWARALRAGGPPARWMPPGELHLTLAFLGPVGEVAARAAWATVDPAALPGPFELTLGPLGRYGPRRRFSAVAAEPVGAGRAAAIACIEAARDPALAAAGARPDTRPPRPHVTVLRPRSSEAERAAVSAWVDAPRPPVGAAWVDAVALYTWASDRPRRLFEVVERRGLLT